MSGKPFAGPRSAPRSIPSRLAWATYLAACLAVWLSVAQAAVEPPQSLHTVTGTLSMLDLSAGKGMLKTDLGKPIFFQVGRPEHFSQLSIGDRITVQLDGEGRAVKVIETLPAEVHEPPPAPRP